MCTTGGVVGFQKLKQVLEIFKASALFYKFKFFRKGTKYEDSNIFSIITCLDGRVIYVHRSGICKEKTFTG